MNRIKIFKAGTHTSMQGVSQEYTKDMLAACVSAYKPDVHEAPLVLGHPKHNDPAMGWVDHLELDADGALWAYPKQVDPDFAENVNAGRHKKVSASFYLPDSPNNPVPGQLYLRHVGFLGAQPPAIKGLGTVNFAEDETGIADFSDYGDSLTASLFRRMRDWLIEEKGIEDADKIVPNWLVESLHEFAHSQPAELAAAYAECAQDAGIELLQPKADEVSDPPPAAADHSETKTAREIELETSLAQANATLEAQALAEQKSLASDFAESLVEAGQLPPKLKDQAISLLTTAQQRESTADFAEGEISIAQGLQDLLAGLPKIVSFGEFDKKGNVDPKFNHKEDSLISNAEQRAKT